ncbi:MAG: tyrosine-type recombinase/integrase [Candidatus Diapherotrites archaeon]
MAIKHKIKSLKAKDWNKTLKTFLSNLPERVGKTNSKLISDYVQNYKALPSMPSVVRCLTEASRLRTISRLVDNKSLIALTEADIKAMNLKMAEEEFSAAQEYRKALKKFWRLTDKKKFLELIESDYLKAPKAKHRAGRPNPEKFWSQQEIDAYISESKRFNERQLCWASLWLSSGCRPHELLQLRRSAIKKENGNVIISVPETTKTGSRRIVLQNSDAEGVWSLCQPYLDNLNPEDLLFAFSYEYIWKIHRRMCRLACIPKEKDWRLYVARKMALSRFYSEYSLPKAAALAGHTVGAESMKHYVALTQEQLEGGELTRVAVKHCPSCNNVNEPQAQNCKGCGAPLDKKQFSELVQKNAKDLVETQMALLKSEMKNMVLEILATAKSGG